MGIIADNLLNIGNSLAKVDQGVIQEATLRGWLDGALMRADSTGVSLGSPDRRRK